MKSVVVVIDDNGDEALYVSGILTSADGPTVYACDIAEAVGDELIQFSHKAVERVVEVWPKKLEDVYL